MIDLRVVREVMIEDESDRPMLSVRDSKGEETCVLRVRVLRERVGSDRVYDLEVFGDVVTGERPDLPILYGRNHQPIGLRPFIEGPVDMMRRYERATSEFQL